MLLPLLIMYLFDNSRESRIINVIINLYTHYYIFNNYEQINKSAIIYTSDLSHIYFDTNMDHNDH